MNAGRQGPTAIRSNSTFSCMVKDSNKNMADRSRPKKSGPERERSLVLCFVTKKREVYSKRPGG